MHSHILYRKESKPIPRFVVKIVKHGTPYAEACYPIWELPKQLCRMSLNPRSSQLTARLGSNPGNFFLEHPSSRPRRSFDVFNLVELSATMQARVFKPI